MTLKDKKRVVSSALAIILVSLLPLSSVNAQTVKSAGYNTVASGVLVKSNDKAQIDYSNTADGYICAKFAAKTSNKIKVQVKGPSVTYTYNLTAGDTNWTVLPLSEGNGKYDVSVFEGVSGNKYSLVISANFTATLTNNFAPFLRSNQYVNFENATNTKNQAATLCKGLTGELDKVNAVYSYVVNNFTYDNQKAQTVKSGYLPSLDKVLQEKKGICFDYAALMTAMLRSQGIPCKLVVGYAGDAYHAWINVWSEKDGWITAAIYFDGSTWQRMDPTFASSAKESADIMKYIGDGSHYAAKYYY